MPQALAAQARRQITQVQKGKCNKLGGSIKLVLELPGSQGKKGYLIKQIESQPLGRELFSAGTKFSQRTFVFSANVDASSG